MTAPAAKKRITLQRDFQATLAEVWALWTTKDGIESWWGPDGFRVEVRSLDLRPGGELRYGMIAVAPEMIDFMKKNGMPTVSETLIRYREIAPRERLVYVNVVDFVPGVTAYDVDTVVELSETATGVRLKLTLDPMHDDVWTQRASMGWEMELGKLERLLAARSK
jgi:uncharacterized protein YndB with AHSA1/START domain